MPITLLRRKARATQVLVQADRLRQLASFRCPAEGTKGCKGRTRSKRRGRPSPSCAFAWARGPCRWHRNSRGRCSPGSRRKARYRSRRGTRCPRWPVMTTSEPGRRGSREAPLSPQAGLALVCWLAAAQGRDVFRRPHDSHFEAIRLADEYANAATHALLRVHRDLHLLRAGHLFQF